MNWTKWSSLAEIVSSVAILGTLADVPTKTSTYSDQFRIPAGE
jgi:hypothetical protein